MSATASKVSLSRRLVWPVLAVLMALAVWLDSRTTSTTTSLPAEPTQRNDSTRRDDDLQSPTVQLESTSTRDAAPVQETSHSQTTTESALTLLVREANGTPVSDARYIVVDSVNKVQRGELDARGSARLNASDGTGELFVLREAILTQSAELDLSPGERIVTLPATFIVSGAITVGGATPVEPLLLRLANAKAPPLSEELPEDVVDELDSNQTLETKTSPRGGFEFGGLSADWSGRLDFPRGYEIATGQSNGLGTRELPLDRPTRGVLVDLVRLPHLVGRIVDSQGGPARKIFVIGRFTRMDDSITFTSVETDDAGRFAFPLRSPVFRACRIHVDHAVVGRLDHAVDMANLGEDLDVGTLTTSAMSALRFRVVDADSAPVSGASCRLEDVRTGSTSDRVGLASAGEIASSSPQVSVRPSMTDEHGLASVSGVTPSSAQLRVLARGFRAAVVPVSFPSDEVLEVRLTPANRLTITVFDRERKLARGVAVMLASSGRPLFADNAASYLNDTMIGLIAGSALSAGQDVGPVNRGWIVVQPDQNARVSFQGLTTELALNLTVLDALGRAFFERSVEPMGETEHRELELVLPDPLRVLTGVVRDADGIALEGARVELAPPKDEVSEYSRTSGASTDAEGEFALTALSVPTVTLTVHGAGFARKRLVDLRLDAPTTHVEIVLQRARTVTVEVVDEQGHAVEHGTLQAKSASDGTSFDCRKTHPGRFEIRDAAPDELALELQLAGRRFTLRNFPTDPSARFVVPVLGQLAITFEPPADVASTSYVFQLRSADPEISVQQRILLRDANQIRLDFVPVLPGDYTLTLERLRAGQIPESIGAPLAVRIESGATTDIKWPH